MTCIRLTAIHKIERIQNRKLWKVFQVEKENLDEKVKDLLRAIYEPVHGEHTIPEPLECIRLDSKIRGRPGIVKVGLRTLGEKLEILWHKKNLAKSSVWEDVVRRRAEGGRGTNYRSRRP